MVNSELMDKYFDVMIFALLQGQSKTVESVLEGTFFLDILSIKWLCKKIIKIISYIPDNTQIT